MKLMHFSWPNVCRCQSYKWPHHAGIGRCLKRWYEKAGIDDYWRVEEAQRQRAEFNAKMGWGGM